MGSRARKKVVKMTVEGGKDRGVVLKHALNYIRTGLNIPRVYSLIHVLQRSGLLPPNPQLDVFMPL